MNWNTRVVVVLGTLLLALAVVILTAGCATDHLTKDEVRGIGIECLYVPACMVVKTTALKADKIYEAEDRFNKYLDQYDATVAWCATQGGMSMFRDYHCGCRINTRKVIGDVGWGTTLVAPAARIVSKHRHAALLGAPCYSFIVQV